MNADQKKRIAHEISNWKNACNCRAVQLTGDRMAALLQELVDAPEPEPVARVTGYYAGYLSIATVDGSVLPAGTALYAAPPHQSEHHLEMVNTPAPSVPDGWMRAIDEALVVHHIDIADSSDGYEEAKKKLNELLAINSDIARDCSEPPADLVRDAERGPETLLLRQLQDLLADYGLFELLSAVRRVEQDETIRLQNAAIERDKLKGAK